LGVILIVLVALFVILHLAGVGLGPGSHIPAAEHGMPQP
jgi:hypothetical protein